jgi:hypothetical protein
MDVNNNPSHVRENSTFAARQILKIVFTSGNLNNKKPDVERAPGSEY